MNLYHSVPDREDMYWSTSSAGSIKPEKRSESIPLGSFFEAGTVSRNQPWNGYASMFNQTTAGHFKVDDKTQDTGSAIMELRRLSGLTWEKLAELFGVARRSLHLWASGKSLSTSNEERLWTLLTTIRETDRGASSANKSMLLRQHGDVIPFDLLAKGEYGRFVMLVGTGSGEHSFKSPRLSKEAWDARKPPAPDNLMGALHDTVHKEKGNPHPVRARKVRKQKS